VDRRPRRLVGAPFDGVEDSLDRQPVGERRTERAVACNAPEELDVLVDDGVFPAGAVARGHHASPFGSSSLVTSTVS